MWVIALCFCTCVILKSQKTLLEILWKSQKEPLGKGTAAGWRGCNILELAVIAEYSGRQVGAHLLVLFLHFTCKSQRENGKRDASIKCEFFKFAVALSINFASCLNVQNIERQNSNMIEVIFYINVLTWHSTDIPFAWEQGWPISQGNHTNHTNQHLFHWILHLVKEVQ